MTTTTTNEAPMTTIKKLTPMEMCPWTSSKLNPNSALGTALDEPTVKWLAGVTRSTVAHVRGAYNGAVKAVEARKYLHLSQDRVESQMWYLMLRQALTLPVGNITEINNTRVVAEAFRLVAILTEPVLARLATVNLAREGLQVWLYREHTRPVFKSGPALTFADLAEFMLNGKDQLEGLLALVERLTGVLTTDTEVKDINAYRATTPKNGAFVAHFLWRLLACRTGDDVPAFCKIFVERAAASTKKEEVVLPAAAPVTESL